MRVGKLSISQTWLILGLLSAFLLSACGFHLKGTQNIGQSQFKQLFLLTESNTRPELTQLMQEYLQMSGTRLVAELAQADATLELGATALTSSITSYASQGDVASKLLTMTQTYQLTLKGQSETLLQDEARVLRDLNVNAQASLAALQAQSELESQMVEDLVQQILRRLEKLPASESL